MCVQVFSLSKEDELRREEVCADARGHDGDTVSMLHCHGHHGNQQWKHDRVMTSHPSSPRSKPTSCHNPSNHRLLLSLRSSVTLPDHTVVRTRDSKVLLRAILSSDNSFKQFVHTRASVAMTYNTIQYKICKAPCCRGFRGAGHEGQFGTGVRTHDALWLGR